MTQGEIANDSWQLVHTAYSCKSSTENVKCAMRHSEDLLKHQQHVSSVKHKFQKPTSLCLIADVMDLHMTRHAEVCDFTVPHHGKYAIKTRGSLFDVSRTLPNYIMPTSPIPRLVVDIADLSMTRHAEVCTFTVSPHD